MVQSVSPARSHVADVIHHHVGGLPSFIQEKRDGLEFLYSSSPLVGVSVCWVFPQVQNQSMCGGVSSQSLSKLQQIRREDEVGAAQDRRQNLQTITRLKQEVHVRWI